MAYFPEARDSTCKFKHGMVSNLAQAISMKLNIRICKYDVLKPKTINYVITNLNQIYIYRLTLGNQC